MSVWQPSWQPSWQLPDHIADVLPIEARQIEELRRDLLDTARRYGYELVMPPLLEHIESLLTGTGEALDLQTFKLVDQLQRGARVPRSSDAGKPLRKQIGFMSNSFDFFRNLSGRCQGSRRECSRPRGGMFFPRASSICKAMARYSRALCRAMLHGLAAELRADGRLQPGCCGVQAADEDCVREIYGRARGYSGK